MKTTTKKQNGDASNLTKPWKIMKICPYLAKRLRLRGFPRKVLIQNQAICRRGGIWMIHVLVWNLRTCMYYVYVFLCHVSESNGPIVKDLWNFPIPQKITESKTLSTLKTTFSSTNSWFVSMFGKLSSWPHMSRFLLKMAASPHLQRQAPALVMAASLLKSLAAGAAAEQVPKKLGICREGRTGKHMLERNGVDISHQEDRGIHRNCTLHCI